MEKFQTTIYIIVISVFSEKCSASKKLKEPSLMSRLLAANPVNSGYSTLNDASIEKLGNRYVGEEKDIHFFDIEDSKIYKTDEEKKVFNKRSDSWKAAKKRQDFNDYLHKFEEIKKKVRINENKWKGVYGDGYFGTLKFSSIGFQWLYQYYDDEENSMFYFRRRFFIKGILFISKKAEAVIDKIDWYDNVYVGENCKIDVYVEFMKNIIIANSTVIGEGTFISKNCFIGADCVIDEYCFIGKNCFLGEKCILNSRTFIGKHTLCENNVFLGKLGVFPDSTSPASGEERLDQFPNKNQYKNKDESDRLNIDISTREEERSVETNTYVEIRRKAQNRVEELVSKETPKLITIYDYSKKELPDPYYSAIITESCTIAQDTRLKDLFVIDKNCFVESSQFFEFKGKYYPPNTILTEDSADERYLTGIANENRSKVIKIQKKAQKSFESSRCWF